jgi:DoxX-like family
MALLQWPAYAAIIRHLNYPDYLMTIIGVCYTLAGVALLAPRFPSQGMGVRRPRHQLHGSVGLALGNG